MERWQNKVAVVTGASSGIGAATSKALVAKGMIVVGLARRYELMENELKLSFPIEQRQNFHPYKCDVTIEQDVLNAFSWIKQKFGGVDVLVNNAGVVRRSQIVTADNTKDMRDIIDTNLMGAALCIREAYQSMKDRNISGHVIIMNSIAGHKVPNLPNFSINMYSPSKFALVAMAEVLRLEFLTNQTKIKVTSISPGSVLTDIVPHVFDNIPENHPILKAEDVADAVVYCLQTPPHVQIHEMIIKPVGEEF